MIIPNQNQDQYEEGSMKIIIFGATGFIGKKLIENLLRTSADISIVTRNKEVIKEYSDQKVSVFIGDMLHKVYPDLTKFDFIINCAGETRDESLMRPLHLTAVENALAQLTEADKVHWIQISSVGVYGSDLTGDINESNAFSPVGEYEITKAEGELLVKKECLRKNIHYTIIRPSNVFGPGMTSTYLSELIKSIKSNLFFFIGNPKKNIMNYVHVDDVVCLIETCLTHPNAVNQDFIISDSITQLEFIKIVSSLYHCRRILRIPLFFAKIIVFCGSVLPGFPLTYSRLSALTVCYKYSSNKAETYLNFSLVTGVVTGLKQYCKSSNRNGL